MLESILPHDIHRECRCDVQLPPPGSAGPLTSRLKLWNTFQFYTNLTRI